MSATAARTTVRAGAPSRPAPRPVVRPQPARTPTLRLVAPRPRTAGRAPFAALLVGLLVSGLLSLLALNTLQAQDAFALHELEAQGRELTLREQLLQGQVQDLEAPAALAERAAALGLVPSGPPAFLRLPDGAVLGEAAPGKTPPAPPAAPAQAAPSAPDVPPEVLDVPAAGDPAAAVGQPQ